MTDTISVIVPVYRVEPYLRPCIDSILAQTYKNLEVILVDDGSPDNCGAICDKYAARDSRIIVIHQENGGLSAARNAGLNWIFANSRSQWITFVDSDDHLDPTCLEKLYLHARETGADITVTGGQVFQKDHELESAPAHIVSVRSIPGTAAAAEAAARESFFMGYAWGKLFRRDLFAAKRFPLGKLYEDIWLIPQILYTANTVTVLHSWLYHYRQRPDSIVHTNFSLKQNDIFDALDANIDFFRSEGASEIVNELMIRRKTRAARNTLLAFRKGLLDQVPKSHKMPVLKAALAITGDTLSTGGIALIRKRLKNLRLRSR